MLKAASPYGSFLAMMTAVVGLPAAHALTIGECKSLLLPDQKAFSAKLHQKNPTLHTSTAVERELERQRARGNRPSLKPADKISHYFDLLKQVHDRAFVNEFVRERLRKSYRRQYVIKKEEIPEAYFANRQRIAREQGRGGTPLTKPERDDIAQSLIGEQSASLDTWFDYLVTSPDYPLYAKYWAFHAITKLSRFDPELGTFAKRSAGTVAPFPELNAEALAYVMNQFTNYMKKNLPTGDVDVTFAKLLETEDFAKLYGYWLKSLSDKAREIPKQSDTVEGLWVKYPKGSDSTPLFASLHGKNTGWCTAQASTARSQLQGGDFHVFYSNDKAGRPSEPRAAIRMVGSKIAEVRGVAKDQNLEPEILKASIVREKLSEFGPEGARYEKNTSDMARLTEIDRLDKAGQKLDDQALRFLYEVDAKIEGFGQKRDPRLTEILEKRNRRADYAQIFKVKEIEISFDVSDFRQPGIKVHIGDLDLSGLANIDGLSFPETVLGSLNLGRLTSVLNFKFPTTIRGDLDLKRLTNASGLDLSGMTVSGLNLSGLISAKGVKLPKTVEGGLDLGGLITAEGLELPDSVLGNLNLSSLISAQGLVLPSNLEGSLNLHSLTDAFGLNLPKRMEGGLGLYKLKSAEGLKLPAWLGGALNLGSLASVKGLTLPETMMGTLDLSKLVSAPGLKLPTTMHGSINLDGLASAKGLEFPASIEGNLNLGMLNDTDGLILPTKISGNLTLSSLVSAEGLILPRVLSGFLSLSGLKSGKGLKLPETLSGQLALYGITSAKDLVLPKYMDDSLNLGGLLSAEDLVLPVRIGGNLDLTGLKSAKGFTPPRVLGGKLMSRVPLAD